MADKLDKPTIFISYSHQDEPWKDRLAAHLKVLERQGQIAVWDTGDIDPGTDWAKEIQKSIDKADLAIPLISPDFLASDAVSSEISALLNRQKKGQLAVIPLLVRPTNWTQNRDLA